ncbi:protocadherin gamma-A10-like isoform X8 [Lagopus muta]|uniref:protocadherin gamma-A10-like isoform X8 n=1 Tax=Lagopus muta TaxID=64668 RepID=UPI00209E7BCE|nr:protocadherin gamma-A10-like isoform X8 [Lagopus muta]
MLPRQRQRRCSVEPCVQCRAWAAGAAVHRGGEEGAERCRQPRPLRPGSLARSLAVSASGRLRAAERCGAVLQRGGGAAGAVGSGRRAGAGAREGERDLKEEVGVGAARERRWFVVGRSVREMCAAREGRWCRSQRALLWCVLVAAWEAAWGQLRYSVPEELPKGSFVGDVAEDLALELAALGGRGARVVSQGRTQYFAVHASSGHLVTAERIDREQLCESEPQCVLRCELIVEGEMKVYAIEVEITDINDNTPTFRESQMELRISEMRSVGSRFILTEANDPDVGVNSLQSYALSGDEHFSLSVQAGGDGEKRPELVLAKALDREEAAFHELLLRASDGGDPSRTGTARIRVAVLDANDNAPAFSQAVYTVRVPEDVPVGSTLLSVTATDPDEGTNGDVKYSMGKVTNVATQFFHLEIGTGAIRLVRNLDFEEGDSYELEIQARDGGDLFDTAKVSISVTDVNDNAPEIWVRSALSEISEDAAPGTVVALVHVQDRDSGANGEVRCSLGESVPFRLERALDDYYSVVTARELDRERASEYNVTVRASDGGSPSLRSGAVLALRVLDVNDNAPVFAEARYSARVSENNAEGALVLTQAQPNPDWRFSQTQRPGTSGSQNGEEGGAWPNNQFDTEMLQAMILASANEAADVNATLGGGTGTMGLSARYGPQFTLQHVPDYRQNVYIPGSTATLTNAAGKRDAKPSGGNKKKSGKKEKK